MKTLIMIWEALKNFVQRKLGYKPHQNLLADAKKLFWREKAQEWDKKDKAEDLMDLALGSLYQRVMAWY